jgi:molecular chaperone DnaK (HSP70)
MDFMDMPKFGKTRKHNESELAKNTEINDIATMIKTYMIHSFDGKVQSGMGILDRLFPSEDQRALREQQAQVIEQEGKAKQRMIKIFYDSVTNEIEQAAQSRYELTQLSHDANFASEHLLKIENLYAQAKPQLQDAINNLLDDLEQIERLPEEYQVQSKKFADEIYYSRLAQVMMVVRTFMQRTNTLCR